MEVRILTIEELLPEVDKFCKTYLQKIVDTWNEKEAVKLYEIFRDVAELANNLHKDVVEILLQLKRKPALCAALRTHLIDSFGESFILPNWRDSSYILITSDLVGRVRLDTRN